MDDARASAAGIRKLTGRHLTLYTDLPPGAEVDSLPAVFDAAVPQWAAWCGVPLEQTGSWRVQAYLIGQRERFEALGLMPGGDNPFVHGISMGREVWLNEQPSAYYRRHLLLHEGTHAFMVSLLGGGGPGWFMEGTAELLATHTWDGQSGTLRLRHMPRTSDEVPMLGRIRLIEDARAAGGAWTLPAVLNIDNRRQLLDNEVYAWTWAAARFLDDHPRYRDRFRSLLRHTADRNFHERFRALFAADWADLVTEWQVFVATLDHGHDVARTAIDFQRGEPLAPERGASRAAAIAADRGWQPSGVWLEAGQTYRVTAQGRYQIAREEGGTPWPCEAGGVTMEYHGGRPLGMLLGAIDDRDANADGGNLPAGGTTERGATESGFLSPMAIGLSSTITPRRSGTLYLKVNDSPGRLVDNAGQIQVSVRRE